ncbi:hypothetical protein [Burkholderia phage BCSR5]|nr:hypothetical protein [Burkholderia phage BCSR5]
MTEMTAAQRILASSQVTALHGEQEKLEQLVQLFLQINPKPSDQQFHALAESLAVDKETLEAISYQMLGEEINEGGLVEGDIDIAGETPAGDAIPGPEIIDGQEYEKEEPMLMHMSVAGVGMQEVEGCDEANEVDELLQDEMNANTTTPDEDVLSGDYDQNTTDTDLLLLNDGDQNPGSNTGFQDETYDDGVGPSTVGIGLDGDQAALNNDGNMSTHIAASTRLKVNFED